MEQLRKVVAVGCLTYLLYGLISYFQLGVFLPPLPLKPFLFIGFAIFGIVNAVQSGIKKLDVLFYLWVMLISFFNQSFLELFFSTQEMLAFQDSIEIVFQLIAVILFVLFNSFIIHAFQKLNPSFAIYYFVLASLTFMIFALPEYVGLQESTVILGLLYLVTQIFIRNTIENHLVRTIVTLTGIVLIETVEMIVLFQ